jgi:hypothetical protein
MRTPVKRFVPLEHAIMIKPNPITLALSACLLLAVSAAQADTLFSAFFNNGTGSSGDKNASVYNWSSAIGSAGTLDNTLTGAPAQVGVSQGGTSGVPVVSGQSTAAGFLFARPDAAPGAMLLHTTLLTTSNVFQDAPQGNWFRYGSDSLTGLTIGNITQLSVYTRAATAVTRMRFAIRIGADWYVSSASFTQANLAAFEQHTLSGLTTANAWRSGVFTSGTFLDADASDNPTVTLAAGDVITGYGWYVETGAQSGDNARVRIDSFQILVSTAIASSDAVVTLAGNSGTEEFKDVMELSDGTLLVAGSAQNLDWIDAPKTQLPPLAIPNRATGRTAFIMRLSGDTRSVLGVWHLPAGQAHDFRWIKGTHKPGQPTGDLYLSGACDVSSGEYFIARLDTNFIAATPGGFSWVKVAKASAAYGDNLGLQAWDVGGDGRVAYVDETGEAIRVFLLDATGVLMKLPGLRGSHWAAGAALDNANRQAGIGADLPATTVSGITFSGDLRSWTETDQLAILPDGNGQIKRGTWPLDLFIPVRDRNGGTSGTIEYGYTGYKSVGKHRIGGIAINRDTNDFSIGFNIQSRFWDAPANKEQPDFEPAVISYAANGALKWWSRLYHEVIDSNANGQVNTGETRLSSPDQYVDGLVVDYSATPNRLVVSARCHGNNEVNLWNGNSIAATPGAQGFHNQFTGTEGNIHLSWIGKIRETDGVLTNSSYLAGYLRDVSLTQAVYGDPNLDGWPSHNAGWPNLTTTRAEPGSPRIDAAGRVYVVGLGPRMVTTASAWQKLPKITPSINQGISPWAQFARVMEPNLNTLTYSTAITGEWTYPAPGAQPLGADNTDLYGIFPVSGGLIAVGRQRNSGNPVPTGNVPSWGTALPSGVSALFVRLPFSGGGSAPSTLPFITQAPAATPAVVSGTTTQLTTLASDPADPESALTYTWSVSSAPAGGSAVFSPNGTNDAKQSTATFNRAGVYTLIVTVTDLSGKSAFAQINVTVSATATALTVAPSVTSVDAFAPFTFQANLLDQFSQPIPGQSAAWSVSGGGTISSTGVFNAGSAPGGPHTVTATLGGFTATAQVTVFEAFSPHIYLPQGDISQAVQAGATVSRALPIENLGNLPLQWTASAFLPGAGGAITTFETSAQSGGPAFEWIDISFGSTTIWAPTGSNDNDDSVSSISFPAGFSFPFYGNSFTSAFVCSNGFVHFGGTVGQQNFLNTTLPSTSAPASLIAAVWTDWVVDSQSWVKWKAVDSDTLVITWNNVMRYGLNMRATFQLILRRSGEIRVQVRSFTPTNLTYTVGIQNAARNTAVLASYNPSSSFIPVGSASNFAVRFPVPDVVPTWLTIQPASGNIDATSAGGPQLLFDATALAAGSYQALLEIQSNDPYEPSLTVPLTLNVGTAPVPPNAPGTLAAVPSAAGEVTLSWQLGGGGNTGHRAEYRVTGDPTWTTGPSYGASTTAGVIPGLAAGVPHEFRLFATSAAVDSVPSNTASATLWSDIEAWRFDHFGTIANEGDAADSADPDHDNIENLLEFALLGGDPMVSNASILPAASWSVESGDNYLTLTVAKNPDASGISYTVQTCGDLASWNHGLGHTAIVQENAGSLIVRDAIPLKNAARRFIHLKVTRP